MSEIKVTVGGKEESPATVDLYTEAFKNDPVISYFLNSLQGDKLIKYRRTLFEALLKAAAFNKGIWYEAHKPGEGENGPDATNHCCRAILMPPQTKLDGPVTVFRAGVVGVVINLGFGGVRRILSDYVAQADKAKAKGLKGIKRYYYIYIIATHEQCRGQGLSSHVIREIQRRAEEEGIPVWLEATTVYSRQLYISLGFEEIEEFILGKGKVGPDGLKKQGGEGVVVATLVWRPPKKAAKG